MIEYSFHSRNMLCSLTSIAQSTIPVKVGLSNIVREVQVRTRILLFVGERARMLSQSKLTASTRLWTDVREPIRSSIWLGFFVGIK